MKNWLVIMAGIALCAAAGPAQAQAPAVRVNLTGRVQVQWNSTSVNETEAGATAPIAFSTFETRRVRLGADIAVGDWISGRVEPDFAMGRLQLRQAWIAMALDPAFVLRAGQFKKPFSAISLASSTRHAMIERGVRIRGLEAALSNVAENEPATVRDQMLIGEQYSLLERQLYLGYDLGAAVEGSRGGLGWSLGAFNGAGADTRAENDGMSTAARLTFQLSAAQPLRVGAAWSRRELNWPEATSTSTRSGNAFEVDLEYGGFRRGPWLLAELSTGRNLATLEDFAGAQLIGSYFVATGGARVEGIEPMARVSWGDPDRTVAGDAGVLITPGFNLYFFGQNRLMFNWDVYVPETGDAQHAGRAQANVFF